MNTKRLEGKVAVITGSTSGIGAATARLFAKEGAAVVVSGRRTEKGELVCDEIIKTGGTAIFIRADVTVDEDLENLFYQTRKQFGRIDILINNAGIFIPKPFSESTPDDWDFMMNTDGRSNFVSLKKILPIMEKQGGGVIVNVTSLCATMPKSRRPALFIRESRSYYDVQMYRSGICQKGHPHQLPDPWFRAH